MPNLPTSADREAFYAAALVGLRALDARERVPRRFGPEADARWAQFKGALGLGDRLDLLLRDGAVTWGAAFSPSLVFGFFCLADAEWDAGGAALAGGVLQLRPRRVGVACVRGWRRSPGIGPMNADRIAGSRSGLSVPKDVK